MADQPLMPKATAVWLIDNTSLSFDQIAAFCSLHALEVKGIADGDVAAGVRGLDPIANGQLTREEIEKAQADTAYRMKLLKPKHNVPQQKRKGPRYTPVSRRQDRPDAILWMVRNHPEVPDSQISKLLGTTKPTIQSVRERTHWNSANLKPVDPVTLGLCSQIELDAVVKKAAKRREKMDLAKGPVDEGPKLEPVADAPAAKKEETAESVFGESAPAPKPQDAEERIDPSKVFGDLNNS